MLKVAIVSKHSAEARSLAERLALVEGIALVGKAPSVVVSLGGDGTLLLSERAFPGIPKIAVRVKESVCKSCAEDDVVSILRAHSAGRARAQLIDKISAEILRKGKVIARLLGANDIVVRNLEPYHALRFSLSFAGKGRSDFIGDGVVVATSFGSTGYFKSVSGRSFSEGFGLALNNPTVRKGPFLSGTPSFEIRIGRNAAVACADNDRKVVFLQEGDSVRFSNSKKRMTLLIAQAKKPARVSR